MKLKLAAILALVTLVITLLVPKSALAADYALSGNVQNSYGIAVTEAIVEVKNPTNNAVVTTTTTSSSGLYSLTLPEGTYNIQVTPVASSGLSPTLAVNQVITNTKTLNFILVPTGTYAFSGHVRNSLGETLANQTVSLRNPATNAIVASSTTDSNGYFSILTSQNTYRVQITGRNAIEANAPRFYNLLLSEYSFTQSTYIDFKLPFKKVDVHVEDDSQADFSNVQLQTSTSPTNVVLSVSGLTASLVVSHYDLGTSGVGSLPSTDLSGNATLWLFPTGSNNPYTIIARPPTGSNYATNNVTNVFINGDTSKTITMQKVKVLSGYLYDSLGGTLPNQTISLREPGTNSLIATTTTNSSGFYSIAAIPNSYNIQVTASNNSTSLKAPKTYNLYLGEYSLVNDSTLNLTLPFKKVDIHVKNSLNVPVSNATINTTPTSPVNGVFSVSGLSASLVVSHYSAGGANPLPKTDEFGNATLWLLPNGSNDPYSFVVTPQSGSGYTAATLANNFITSNTSKVIILQKPVTLTGQVLNSLGVPLSNQTVALREPGTNSIVVSTTTTALGNYTLSTFANTYTVQVTGKNSTSVDAPRFYNLLLNDYSLNFNNSLELKLPFKKIDVHIQNPDDKPISDVELKTSTAATNALLSVSGLTASLVVSYYDSNTTGVGSLPRTDSDGNTTLWLFPSGQNYPYNIFGTPLIGSPYSPLTLQNVNVVDNESKIVSLQYNHDAPSTAILLESEERSEKYSNPTVVTLSAIAATGYSITNTYYRLDGGLQQTYNSPFTISGEGEHTIQYWSVDNSGVREVVKTKTFTIYVNEPPMISPISDVNINEGETFTTNGSFTDEDSTSWTATVDYGEGSGPQLLNLNGQSFSLSHTYNSAGVYDVTVVITDEAQNTGSTIATITVNAAPQISELNDKEINQGQAYSATGSFVDNDSTSWSATVDYGDGTGEQSLVLNGKNFSLNHVYATSGYYTVTVSITDNQGAESTETATIVVNAAPQIVDLADEEINVGGTYTTNGSFIDADSSSWTATVDYDDGLGAQALSLKDKSFILNKIYSTAGTYTVSVKVTDNQGITSTKSATIKVNAPPHVNTFNGATIIQGEVYSALGSFIDNDSDTWIATVNYGDGTEEQQLTLDENNFILNHTYASAGEFTVTVEVTDNQGTSGTRTASVFVDALPQINVLVGASINIGETYSEEGSFADSDSTFWSGTVDYGDGSGAEILTINGTSFSLEHIYNTAGEYTVTVQIHDNQGAVGTRTATVAVNAAPEIATLANATINEGSTYSATGNFVDVGSNSWTATVNYGEGTGDQPLSLSGNNFVLSHQYKDNGNYTVEVTVIDDKGASDMQTMTVSVTNLSPNVSAITASINPIFVNASTIASASFTDLGVLDSHTAVWDWGDGSTSTGTVLGGNGSGSVSNSHAYTQAGIYEITLRVTDNSNGQSMSIYQYLTVYNPNSDKVVGSKEFQSPQGAVTNNPSASGTVDFGFRVEYVNGTTSPSSQDIILNFPEGNISFISTGYQWLVVSGSKATFKATGSLNGIPGHTILVSAIDQGLGQNRGVIRVQIKNGTNTIYDTQPGTAETTDPTTPISRGKITVH